jgi:hypothetical protein
MKRIEFLMLGSTLVPIISGVVMKHNRAAVEILRVSDFDLNFLPARQTWRITFGIKTKSKEKHCSLLPVPCSQFILNTLSYLGVNLLKSQLNSLLLRLDFRLLNYNFLIFNNGRLTLTAQLRYCSAYRCG